MSGLCDGASYTFTVTATNSVGTSPASAPSNAVAATSACTLFGSTKPPVPDGGDPDAKVNLGVKFSANVSGFITGIRFYKTGSNTGTHHGILWSSTGTLLAEATFAGESNFGWQQVMFSSPVPVTAGTTYIAAYHTDAGHYSFSGNAFAAGYDSGPLHALADGLSGGNGVFAYGGVGFPTQSFNAANYWVDVTYVPS